METVYTVGADQEDTGAYDLVLRDDCSAIENEPALENVEFVALY